MIHFLPSNFKSSETYKFKKYNRLVKSLPHVFDALSSFHSPMSYVKVILKVIP